MSLYELELDETGAPSLVASLSGELDLTNAAELEERLRRAAPDAGELLVDLNHVVFIDSAVIHVLFRLARDLGAGRLVLLLAPDAPVARVLEIVNMKDAVRIVPSREPLEHASSP